VLIVQLLTENLLSASITCWAKIVLFGKIKIKQLFLLIFYFIISEDFLFWTLNKANLPN